MPKYTSPSDLGGNGAPLPNETAPSPRNNAVLDQLLRRGDVWRGHSAAFNHKSTLATGHSALDPLLLGNGWPLKSLIEAALPLGKKAPNSSLVPAACWFLLGPSLRAQLTKSDGYLLLLNPPAIPFAQGLIQQGIPLNRLLIVNTENKQDFVAAFTELSQATYCHAVIAWQPKQALSYTELRKCQLACDNGQALNILFRTNLLQSSPAPLRLALNLQQHTLNVQVIKQRGDFKQATAELALPADWQSLAPYKYLLPSSQSQQHQNANFKTAANYYFGVLSGAPLAPNNLVPLANFTTKKRR